MKTPLKVHLLFTMFLFVAGCAPSAESIQTAIAQTQAGWTEIPSQTPLATYTALIIVQTKLVTPTFTATPQFTPTITNTPLPPTATPNLAQTATAEILAKLRSPKTDGYYLINVDIGTGVWRSDGNGGSCYWEITKENGDIISNHFGLAGGTMYVPANGFQVQVEDCGTWTFLKP